MRVKKIILMFIFLLFIISCQQVTEEEDSIIKNTIKLFAPFITYKPDPEGTDFWQYPEETMNLKTGDCEDIVNYCRKMIYDTGYLKTNLAVVVHKKTGEGHTLLEYNGKHYECVNAKIKVNMNNYEKKALLFYDSMYHDISMRR